VPPCGGEKTQASGELFSFKWIDFANYTGLASVSFAELVRWFEACFLRVLG
jgi:hypothetical protein